MITETQHIQARERARREIDESLMPWVKLIAVGTLGMVLALALIILTLTHQEWMPVVDRWAMAHPLLVGSWILIGSALVVVKWAKK